MENQELRRRLNIWIRLSEDEAIMEIAEGLVNEVIDNLTAKLKQSK